MITLELNGQRYQGWTEISVMRNIETMSGSFNFCATSSNINTFPIKVGSPCKVFIDNTMVVNGYIDTVGVSYSSNDHSISITGRDRTEDIIDSTIVGVKEFQGMNLIQVIQKVLKDNGLTEIKIINEAGNIDAIFPDNDPAATPISQTVFSFIETYARKRQVLLTTDGKGNIVLARGSKYTSSAVLQNQVDGLFNNIKSANVNYDLTKRFYKYTLQSQQNPAAIGIGFDTPGGADEDVEGQEYIQEGDDVPEVDVNSVVVQNGFAIDSSIRSSRVTEIISKTSDSSVNLTELAEWTKNLARARSKEYTAVVVGHYQDDAKTLPWEPNILVKVIDTFADINATLLIKSVEYKVSLDSGSTSHICLVDSDSYTLQLAIESETEKKKKRANKFGGNLTFDPPQPAQ